MEVLENKSDKQLLASTVAELAKLRNETECALKDLNKIKSRTNFLLVLANQLIERTGD